METKIRLRLFFALLALNPAFSFANDHQICYQKPPIPGFTTITGQFLCRTDGTSTPGCQVTGVTERPFGKCAGLNGVRDGGAHLFDVV